MANHILSNIDRHVPAPIVDSYGMPDHLGENGAGPAPGAYHLFLATFVHGFNLL
jgi:hypothetical protein